MFGGSFYFTSFFLIIPIYLYFHWKIYQKVCCLHATKKNRLAKVKYIILSFMKDLSLQSKGLVVPTPRTLNTIRNFYV